MRRGVLVASALCILALSTTSLEAQHNPNGWIQTSGWNLLFPLENPWGCGAGLGPQMTTNWVAPHDIAIEDPKAGDEWNDIDFGGAATAPGFLGGPLFDGAVRWTSLGWMELVQDLPAGTLTGDPAVNNDVVNFENLAVGAGLPNNWVVGIATTYVDNRTDGDLAVRICSSQDDAIQVWVNNCRVTNHHACQGSGDRCDRYNLGLLPPGISKISVLNWEQSGGWNFRIAVYRDSDGHRYTDADAAELAFLGTGFGDGGIVGQEVLCVDRSVDTSPFHCPQTRRTVTLLGDGPGDPATVDRLTEIISTPLDLTDASGENFDDRVTLSDVSDDGVVEDIVPTMNDALPKVTAFDVLDAVIGTDEGGGSTGSLDAGEYTSVSTTGGDIWADCDDFQFQYTSTPVAGDFDVSLEFLERSHENGAGRWGKFGLMARQSLDRESRHFMIQDHLPNLTDGVRAAGRREHME